MKRTNKKASIKTNQDPSPHDGAPVHPVNGIQEINNSPSSSARCGDSALNDPVVDHDPNQKSEIIHQKSRSRPFQPLPEFASLDREQLDYIHEMLHTHTYDDAQREIWSNLGCRISTNRLQRYREKLDLAAALEIADQDTLPAVDQLNDILAGRDTNIPAAGIHLIQQRALALAASPKTSPTLLKDLFRIFTYEDRRSDNAHRRKIAEQREAARQQTAAESLQLRRFMNEHKQAMDLRRAKSAEQREETRAAAFEHKKQIDLHNVRLAEQRQETRKQLADLAVRKHEDALKIAEQNRPKEFNQSEWTEKIEAIMAYGRDVLKKEAAAKSRSADIPVCASQLKQPDSEQEQMTQQSQ